MALDTLSYVKKLEAAGVPRQQAEAHAEAMRDEVAPQLATKADLDAAVARLDAKIDARFGQLDSKIDARFGQLDSKIGQLDSKIDARYGQLDTKIDTSVSALEQRIEATIWKAAVGVLGGVLAIGGLLIRFLR